MNIFIDAYNLLKQLHGVTQVSPSQNYKFIEQLKRFAHAKKHTVYLVYDGGQSARAESEHSGPITIIHSGYKLSADDIIKQKILNYAHEHTILVSDDRELCDYVSSARFATLGTSDFYKLMKQDIQKQNVAYMKTGVAEKRAGYASSEELDKLMHEASSIGYYKEDSDELQEKYFPTQLSKKEKKLKKLVKKL